MPLNSRFRTRRSKPVSEAKGLVKLLETILNQMHQAKMTEHPGVDPENRTDERIGYRVAQ
jgi:transposase-like protein